MACDDPFAFEWADVTSTEAAGEERMILLGQGRGRILAVVYTERGKAIRLISARKATKHEQRQYYS